MYKLLEKFNGLSNADATSRNNTNTNTASNSGGGNNKSATQGNSGGSGGSGGVHLQLSSPVGGNGATNGKKLLESLADHVQQQQQQHGWSTPPPPPRASSSTGLPSPKKNDRGAAMSSPTQQQQQQQQQHTKPSSSVPSPTGTRLNHSPTSNSTPNVMPSSSSTPAVGSPLLPHHHHHHHLGSSPNHNRTPMASPASLPLTHVSSTTNNSNNNNNNNHHHSSSSSSTANGGATGMSKGGIAGVSLSRQQQARHQNADTSHHNNNNNHNNNHHHPSSSNISHSSHSAPNPSSTVKTPVHSGDGAQFPSSGRVNSRAAASLGDSPLPPRHHQITNEHGGSLGSSPSKTNGNNNAHNHNNNNSNNNSNNSSSGSALKVSGWDNIVNLLDEKQQTGSSSSPRHSPVPAGGNSSGTGGAATGPSAVRHSNSAATHVDVDTLFRRTSKGEITSPPPQSSSPRQQESPQEGTEGRATRNTAFPHTPSTMKDKAAPTAAAAAAAGRLDSSSTTSASHNIASMLGIRTATPAEIAVQSTANDYLLHAFEKTPEEEVAGKPIPIDNLGAMSPIIRTLPYVYPPSPEDVLGGRVIIVGDVHGCVEQLEALLAKVHFDAEHDRLVMVGDLVNKGPDSVGVVRLCQRHRAVAVLGNHDMTLLELCAEHRRKPFTQASLKDPVKRLAITFPSDCEAFLRRLPHVIRIPQYNLIVVHAGIDPRKRIEDQSIYNMLHMRRIVMNGPIPTRHGNGKHSVGVDAEGVVVKGDIGELWGQLYHGPETIIFGHAAKSSYQQHPFAIGLDTGCVYSNTLTCITYSPMSREGTFTAVQGLPKRANESAGLPPPDSDVYEQHLLLPAEAVSRSIVRPTSRVSPSAARLSGTPSNSGTPSSSFPCYSSSAFVYDPSAAEGSRCTPISLTTAVTPFPSSAAEVRNDGSAGALAAFHSPDLLDGTAGPGLMYRPPPSMTPRSLAAALEHMGDGAAERAAAAAVFPVSRVSRMNRSNRSSPSSASPLERGTTGSPFTITSTQKNTQQPLSATTMAQKVLMMTQQKKTVVDTFLALVQQQEYSAIATLLSVPSFDDALDALTEEGREEEELFTAEQEEEEERIIMNRSSDDITQTTTSKGKTTSIRYQFWLPIVQALLRVRAATTPSQTSSSSLTTETASKSALVGVSTKNAELLLFFAVQACESFRCLRKLCKSALEELASSDVAEGNGTTMQTPLSIQKYAKLLLTSDH